MTEEYWSLTARVTLAACGPIVGGFAGAGLMGLVDGTALEYPGLAVFAALIAFGAWRGGTVRVTADSKRLVVRNVLATHVVRRADIMRIRERDVLWFSHHAELCPSVYVRGRRRPVPLLAMMPFGKPDRRMTDAIRRWQRR